MVAAKPLDSPYDGPVTYPMDIKTLIKSPKERNGPTLNKEVLKINKLLLERDSMLSWNLIRY